MSTHYQQMSRSTRRTSIQPPLDLAPEHPRGSTLPLCIWFHVLLLWRYQGGRIRCSPLDCGLGSLCWEDIRLEQGYRMTQAGNFLGGVDSRIAISGENPSICFHGSKSTGDLPAVIVSAAKRIGTFYCSSILVARRRSS